MRLNSVSVLTSIFIVSLSVAPCLVTSQSSHSCSQQQRTRQEWRQLTYTQQQEFISGVKLLKTQVPSIMGQKSRYDDFVLIHSNSGPLIHSTPQFYPWHRKMLADFETELQKVLNNPKFALPYYDWTIDAKNPQASPLLQPGALGTDAAQSASTCLSDGPFSGWNKTVPSAGCVSRGGVSSSVTNYDVVAVECVIQRDNGYDDFRTYAEVPHNSFHGKEDVLRAVRNLILRESHQNTRSLSFASIY